MQQPDPIWATGAEAAYPNQADYHSHLSDFSGAPTSGIPPMEPTTETTPLSCFNWMTCCFPSPIAPPPDVQPRRTQASPFSMSGPSPPRSSFASSLAEGPLSSSSPRARSAGTVATSVQTRRGESNVLSHSSRSETPRAQRMLSLSTQAAQLKLKRSTLNPKVKLNELKYHGEIPTLAVSSEETLVNFAIQILTSSDDRELVAFIRDADLLAFRNTTTNGKPDGKLGVTICKLRKDANFETAEELLAKDQKERKNYNDEYFTRHSEECWDITEVRKKIFRFNETRKRLESKQFELHERAVGYETNTNKGKVTPGETQLVQTLRQLFSPKTVTLYENSGTNLNSET